MVFSSQYKWEIKSMVNYYWELGSNHDFCTGCAYSGGLDRFISMFWEFQWTQSLPDKGSYHPKSPFPPDCCCVHTRVYEMTTLSFIATNKVHRQNINNPNHNLDGRKNLANMPSLSTVLAEKSAFSFHFSYNILWLQGYNALKDYFPTMEMRPNPQCTNSACMERQVLRFRYNPLVHLLK